MSTIIKCLWELAWPAQLAVCFLLLCIVGQLLCVKFGVRWWLGLRGRARGQRQREGRRESNEQINRQQFQTFKHLYPLILKSQTFLEPHSPNLSINKMPPLLTLSIWLYILLTTQLIQPGTEQEGKLMRWLAVLARLAMLLGWVGLVLGVGEMLGRYLWVRGMLGEGDGVGSGIQVQQQIRSQPTPNNNNSNSQQLPPSLYIYLTLLPLTTISLFILTLTHILTAPSFLSQSQAQQRILFTAICLALLIVIHHILVAVLGGIGWLVVVSGLGVRVGEGAVWGLAVGWSGVGGRVGVMEESRENIVVGTERNPVDNFLFTENPDQPSTAPRPNPTTISNTKTQTTLQSRRKKQIFALPNAFTAENEDGQEDGEQKDKGKRRYGSMQLGAKEPIRDEGESGGAVVCRVGRRKKSFFTQSDPTLSQQTSVLSKLIKITPQKQQPSPSDPPANTATPSHALDQPQPILCDIENRLALPKQRSSTKKRSKNDLKVINHDENADRDMQIVDLSQYVVKDLGCAQLADFKQTVQNFKKKKLPSLKLVQQDKGVRDRDNGYYVRRKNSKPPNVSDGVQEGPVVFCVEELKKQ